jgi:hypothetical protein
MNVDFISFRNDDFNVPLGEGGIKGGLELT